MERIVEDFSSNRAAQRASQRKGNLHLPCNETYPTCEMQARCFKPLSIGVQVQDGSFEIHIWQD